MIAKSKKERAEIDADSEVYVRRASMEASKKRLEIDLEERRAEIAQQQEIETLAAAQIAEISREKAESQRASTQAKIEMERAIQEAEVHREQQLALAEQDRQIAVFLKSKEESLARADADKARSQAVLASEELETVKAIAQEKRRAEISKIATEAEASRKAARDLILAKSDVETAKNKATARKEETDAEKYAELAKAETALEHLKVENAREEKVIDFELKKARIEAMPKIVSEMVKPAEKIKSINVNHVSGFGKTLTEGNEKSPVGNAMDSIMDMAVQMPLLKKIGDQMGVSFDDIMDDKEPPKK
ncbi:MAG: flotillin domain-containing protein [Paracoccaceae bacterium]